MKIQQQVSENGKGKRNIVGMDAPTPLLITIVIPIFHEPQELLDVCFRSLTGQSYRKWNCLLINDGSAFRVPSDPRFQVIDVSPCSVGKKRNLGIKAATGDYLLFIDADDRIDWQMLEVAKDIITNAPDDLDIVYFEAENVHSAEIEYAFDISKIRFSSFYGKKCKDVGLGYLTGHPISNGMTTAVAKVFSTRFLRNNSIRFPEEIVSGEDVVFAARCAIFSDSVVYVFDYKPYRRLLRNESSIFRYFGQNGFEYYRLLDQTFSLSEDYSVLRANLPRLILDGIINEICSRGGLKAYPTIGAIRRRIRDEFALREYRELLEIKGSNLNGKKRVVRFLIFVRFLWLLALFLYRKRIRVQQSTKS